MDVLDLINEMEDLIEDGSGVPLTKKVMVDKIDILDIIKEIRIRLPDEVQQASWIKSERQRIIDEAEREAQNIIENAKLKAEELVSDDNITIAAEQRAEETIYRAQETAREIRTGSLEYADDILMKTQQELQSLVELINNNREELRG